MCDDTKKETDSEKLLGVVVNNTLTWKNHLHGDTENIGLIKNLSKRVGILKKLRKFLPNGKFKQIIVGIFTSKLIYCITVWGGIWEISGQKVNIRNTAISKKAMVKLQVLQNKALRLLSGLEYGTPTETPLKHCNELSVHQLVAYHTACQVYKIRTSKLPKYHHNRLFLDENNPTTGLNTRTASSDTKRVEYKLSTGILLQI